MGKGSKQTIGYKYHLGLHMVIAQQIDAVLGVKFQDKIGWSGVVRAGQINMDKPELFGGKKKEGGVSGVIDVLDGNPSQPVNSYLSSVLGSAIPAFRGVASLVFRRCYLGNNPYIKPISVKVQAVHCHFDDWYPEKAEIARSSDIKDVSLYIALDHSLSMTEQRLATMRSAVSSLIDSLRGGRNDVRIVAFNSAIGASITRMAAKDADYDALKAWVSTPHGNANGNRFSVALSEATDFFTTVRHRGVGELGPALKFSTILPTETALRDSSRRRVALIITDGELFSAEDVAAANEIIGGIQGLEVFGFNIDTATTEWTSQIDNTPGDGVPTVSGDDPSALREALARSFSTFVDMNPAHILRDVLIAPSSDGSGDPAEIGESFRAAADLFYREGLGLSFTWENPGSKEEFKKIVENHIDASCYIDRVTGKWEIKPIRDDYDVATLAKFGDGGIPIVSWGDASRPDPRELPNQVTVTYTKRDTGDDGSVTIANIAALQIVGRIKTEKVDYEGVTRQSLASRLCMRDLMAMTTPLLSGTFTAAYVPPDINLGSAILIQEARMGIGPTVVRVTEFVEGDGRDNSVRINFVEDKFTVGDEVLTSEDDVSLPDTVTALPSEHRLIVEAPYYAMVQAYGQKSVDENLTADANRGRLLATGEQPSGVHQNAQLAIDAGSGYFHGGIADFSPVGVLIAELSADPTAKTVGIGMVDGLSEVEVGSLAQIGSEIVRVDNMELVSGGVNLTLGRGCLDTVPAAHPSGARIIFWQVGADLGETDYMSGEQISVKFRPQTSGELLLLDDAETDVVRFNSRAARPYPVGQLQINGSYAPTGFIEDTATITWAHRDRKFQTTAKVEDHTASSIGPEPGVSYRVALRTVEVSPDIFTVTDFFKPFDIFTSNVHRSISDAAVTPANGTSHSLSIAEVNLFSRADFFGVGDIFEGCFTDNTLAVEIGVRTDRDGYENWQTPFVGAAVLLPPVGLRAEVLE